MSHIQRGSSGMAYVMSKSPSKYPILHRHSDIPRLTNGPFDTNPVGGACGCEALEPYPLM
jgi:hypothetical protein